MTSSLPNFAAAPASASAAPVNAASLAELGAAGALAPTGDFADLLPVANAVAECPTTATATPTFTVMAPTFFTLLAPTAAESAEVAAMPEMLPTEATAESATPEGVSRDTMEQAASLLAALVQTLLPQAQPEAAATPPMQVAGAAQPERCPPGLALHAAPAALAHAAPLAGSTDAQSLPLEGAAPDAAPPLTTLTSPVATETSRATSAPADESAIPSYSFEAHLAADGAVEINATLSVPQPKEQGRADKSTPSLPTGEMEVQAELVVPGQAVLRLTATGSAGGEIQGRANFAGKKFTGKMTSHPEAVTFERNFLNTGKEEVKTDSTLAGIAVAKTEATMKTTPTDETRATSNLDTFLGLPARGEFTVAWPSADRHSTPPTISYETNFAQRAVATVSNLVDTQFTASMQKAGSVQLRLKFGGEDLSVRVELRDGAVHTDFRTDSPELRAALHREWQAVASQSADSLRRYIEPVFSPSGDTSTPFNGRQQQQAAQQDLSQQGQQRSSRAQEEDTFTFTRRSLVGEHFAPQSAPSRVAALLPTSVRLSVLA